RRNPKVVGNVMYSARYINLNQVGITDRLASLYSNLAVMPFLGREVAAAPSVATNVRIENGDLKWNASGNGKSVVYYFSDLKKEGKVHSITSATSVPVTAAGYYSVSTLNSDNIESKASEAIQKN